MSISIIKSDRTEYGVVKAEDRVIFTVALETKDSAELKLYSLGGKLIDCVKISPYRISGNVYSLEISGLPVEGFQYEYICDGVVIPDKYLKNHSLKRAFGVQKDDNEVDRAIFVADGFDWEDDDKLRLDYSDIVSYELHVRGFTKHQSSKVKAKGCFAGITEKIQYFKELGINQIELMPAYEFYEINSELDDLPKNHPSFLTEYTLDADGNVIKNLPKTKINYWGYKEGYYFCPKKSYSYSDDAVTEFKEMVKALHSAGIEVIMQMYFPKTVKASLIQECLRFWYMEYHVDGFRLMGERLPLNLILSDDLLADAKLYIYNLDRNNEEYMNGSSRFAAGLDNSFLIAVRKFLKSDCDSLRNFVNESRHYPDSPYKVNYITSYEGFTLNDLVSYEYKHNENNGENNSDGTDYNLSWNCGVEGKSTKKAVKELRLRQIKNALCMLMLSQGTPMLFMGDEMMNSQDGNNNPYCQDNEISWLNWKRNKAADEIFEYTKSLIKLRKEHKVLHQGVELKGMDYLSAGFPDISYHQDESWKVDFSNNILHFAVMLWGTYAKKADGSSDDTLYIAYNMHWNNHNFELPKLKSGMKWELVTSTCSENENKMISAELNNEEAGICVFKRSVIMLKATLAD